MAVTVAVVISFAFRPAPPQPVGPRPPNAEYQRPLIGRLGKPSPLTRRHPDDDEDDDDDDDNEKKNGGDGADSENDVDGEDDDDADDDDDDAHGDA